MVDAAQTAVSCAAFGLGVLMAASVVVIILALALGQVLEAWPRKPKGDR